MKSCQVMKERFGNGTPSSWFCSHCKFYMLLVKGGNRPASKAKQRPHKSLSKRETDTSRWSSWHDSSSSSTTGSSLFADVQDWHWNFIQALTTMSKPE